MRVCGKSALHKHDRLQSPARTQRPTQEITRLWRTGTQSHPRGSGPSADLAFQNTPLLPSGHHYYQNHPGTQHPYLPLVILPKPKPEMLGMSGTTPSCTRDPRLVCAREPSSGTGDKGCFVRFRLLFVDRSPVEGGKSGRMQRSMICVLMDSESRE